MVDRIVIRTRNPDAYFPDSFSDSFEEVQFRVNPTSVSISQNTLTSMRKARLGYVRTYHGEGLFSLSFAGIVNIHPSLSALDLSELSEEELAKALTFSDIKKSSGWQWFQKFAKFVRASQPFLFELHYLGTPLMLSQDSPVFVGECSPVKFSQDAENPFSVSYSFTFQGVLLVDDVDLNYSQNISSQLKVTL